MKTQQCLIDNMEPDENGCYPGWSRTCAGAHVREHMYKFKHLKGKVVRQMEKHRGAAIHWFQNGYPMKALITHHDGMLGVDEKTASTPAKNGTEAKDKRCQPFGNRGR